MMNQIINLIQVDKLSVTIKYMLTNALINGKKGTKGTLKVVISSFCG